MVVNSLNFLLFFIVVFIIYYLPVSRNTPKFQNAWLLITSYFFYGFADWRMIPLLLSATIVFYGIGLWLKAEMDKGNTSKASHITTLGVTLGVCVLLYFKYLNFFAESFSTLFRNIGLNVSWTTLNIVLPIGVSFFTFKLISYIIEVHREHIKPSQNFIEFGTYVAFFPTILSGPIDRPNKFIPSLKSVRLFNYDMAVDGCRQILWGMFTKMCIADNIAKITDGVWQDYQGCSGSTLAFSALLYLIQMFTDFDGYSNMAIGVGKLLGLSIARNFKHPLMARNIAEYWRNWHMSLTGWLTDYVFSPLNIAFRNLANTGIILAIIINFVLIGLWHGANWTFCLFGLYHGLLYIPLIISGTFGKNKKIKAGKFGLPKLPDFLKMISTFCLVSFGLILFRASSLADSFNYIQGMFSISIFQAPSIDVTKVLLFFILSLLLLEWTCRDKEYPLQNLKWPVWVRWSLYVLLVITIFQFKGEETAFIYTQF